MQLMVTVFFLILASLILDNGNEKKIFFKEKKKFCISLLFEVFQPASDHPD